MNNKCWVLWMVVFNRGSEAMLVIWVACNIFMDRAYTKFACKLATIMFIANAREFNVVKCWSGIVSC